MIYLLCFALSIAATVGAELSFKKSKRWLGLLFSAVAIALPALLAGLRGLTVGTDTANYYDWPDYWGGSLRYETFAEYWSTVKTEWLFALLSGGMQRLGIDFHWYLLFCHLFIMTLVYAGFFRWSDEISPALGMTFFFLCYYNASLNIFRQYMAMALIFFALGSLRKNRWLHYTAVVLIASLIHTSALLGLFYLFMFYFFYRKDGTERPQPLFRSLLTLIPLGAGIALFAPLLKLAVKLGVLSEKYLFYIATPETPPAIMISLLVLAELAVLLVFYRELRDNSRYGTLLTLNAGVYLVLLQVSFFVSYGKRIGLYFALFNLVALAKLSSAQRTRAARFAVGAIITAVLFAYWLYYIVLTNSNETLPYIWGSLFR